MEYFWKMLFWSTKMKKLKDKFILDACCGGRMMWFDKKHPNTLYVDKRVKGKGFMSTRKNFSVEPDIKADFRNLPFKDGQFNMVVFDPPHTIRNKEEGGIIAERYGRLILETWEKDLALGFSECWRVLADKGTLIFKWAECDKTMEEIAPFFPALPLYGSRVGKGNKTVWLAFMKVNK